MRVVVHDFAGHPGQVQLSRELARRGHTVEHQYCSSIVGGRGALTIRSDDPPSFSVRAMKLGGEFARYSPLRRILQEIRYGILAVRANLAMRPDVAVFSNVPIVSLALISLALKAFKVPYVFWWQDVYSDAVAAIARRRLGRLGILPAWIVDRVERGVAKRAAAIVPITDAFRTRLQTWAIQTDKVTVVHNWGSLSETRPSAKVNPWSASKGLDGYRVVLYAGTLGLKHDPSLIAELSRNVPDGCRVVVISEGKGRDWLEDNCADDPNMVLLDYQPYDQLSEVLASADVLLAILDQDASRYSVPSKVLTYLCAGRPVLALLPVDNAVAQTVLSAEAGIVVPPCDRRRAVQSLNELLADPSARSRMGRNARRYAERVFDIEAIAESFEGVLEGVVDERSGR